MCYSNNCDSFLPVLINCFLQVTISNYYNSHPFFQMFHVFQLNQLAGSSLSLTFLQHKIKLCKKSNTSKKCVSAYLVLIYTMFKNAASTSRDLCMSSLGAYVINSAPHFALTSNELLHL